MVHSQGNNVLKQLPLILYNKPKTRRGGHTVIVFIYVFVSIIAVSAHARETWRFLPCFGKDVCGVERHAAADGHFHSEVPEQARPLLSEDGGLDESFFAFSDFFSKKL